MNKTVELNPVTGRKSSVRLRSEVVLQRFTAGLLLVAPVTVAILLNIGAAESMAEDLIAGKVWRLRAGEDAFVHYCSPCHGTSGMGDGRYYSMDLEALPISFADSVTMAGRSSESVRAVIE